MWIYAILSVLIISLVSLTGALILFFSQKTRKKLLLLLVSFAAGGLLGGAFLHLLPELIEEQGFDIKIAFYILLGIVVSFFMEKIIRWHHCHLPITKNHVHPLSIMNLFGDGVHNFIDGLIIGASYLISIPVGLTTSLAVLLHEIPQEIGDFGILLYGGFSKKKAILFNLLTALTAVLGVVVALVVGSKTMGFTFFLIPFAIGSFIYIAGSDLIPELHHECSVNKSFLEFIMLLLGIGIMALILLIK